MATTGPFEKLKAEAVVPPVWKPLCFRQGEVLFEEVGPEEARGLPEFGKAGEDYRTQLVGSGVIEEGETSGHAHRLGGEGELYRYGTGRYINTGKAGAEVTHEEHKTINLPGERHFRVTIQREYDEAQRQRNVLD